MAENSAGPFAGPDIVDDISIKNDLSKVLTTSAGKNSPEIDCDEEDETMMSLTSDQIKEAFTGKGKDMQSIKIFVRSYNLSTVKDERKVLFQEILQKTNEKQKYSMDTGTLLDDTLKSCFGTTDMQPKEPSLPSCVDAAHTNHYFLTHKGKVSVARLLRCYAYNTPEVQYCPMLFSITSILRHYLSENETYNFISNLTSSKQPKYFSQNKKQVEIAWKVVYYLCEKTLDKHVKFLKAEASNEEVEGLFQQWLWWIFDWLPFPHVVRIMDSYLLEGEKVLFRVCFAILSYFVRHIKSKSSSWTGSIKQRGLQGAFIHFCKEIPVTPNSLLNKGFRYRNFSKASIDKFTIIVEADLKAKADGELYLADVSSFTSDNKNRTTVSDVRGDIPDASLLESLSSILSYKQIVTIWKWIPDRITMNGTPPCLAYSTDNDGFSLKTFYNKTEVYEPTVLVIKTVAGEIFGAYCSTSWAERNAKDDKGSRQVYFGTGESFLFSFALSNQSSNGQEQNGTEETTNGIRYPWIFADSSKIDESLSKQERHARELFLSGQHDMISIGGGSGNGIYLDSTLDYGKTETCLTFNNPPLCNEKDFQIATIEVFGLSKIDY